MEDPVGIDTAMTVDYSTIRADTLNGHRRCNVKVAAYIQVFNEASAGNIIGTAGDIDGVRGRGRGANPGTATEVGVRVGSLNSLTQGAAGTGAKFIDSRGDGNATRRLNYGRGYEAEIPKQANCRQQ